MAAYIDQFTAESLLVIKKPPIEAPTIVPFKNNGDNTYLQDRFICFAYRYQYADGEYSATSQFSDPAFIAGNFQFDISTFLNEGMLNVMNAVTLSYNTGGPLVKDVEILFKEMDNPVIRVVEKLNKLDLGLADNDIATFVFDNQKIFTVLPETEILRLYDNVPLKAQAQTIMGNRLFYGNYVESYNLVDKFNDAVQFNYSTTLETSEVGAETLPFSQADAQYVIDGWINKPNARFNFDLEGTKLVKGASIEFDISILHNSFSGNTPFPTDTTTDKNLNFTYILQQDFSSVFNLATDPDFVAKIGSATTISTVANSCTGSTFTDVFNCEIPNQLDAYYKKASGISAVDQPIQIYTSANSTEIGLQFPAMQFVDNIGVPTQTFYEYYEVTAGTVSYRETTNNYSLHSNRGYQIGIVYMDEFGRSSTAQISQFDTVSVPCSNSNLINKIQVTIPGGGIIPAQIAPYWAERYKFVIKADRDNYETIYTNIFYEEPDGNAVYFLLEGENAQKVNAGDRLIVKRDNDGSLSTCVFTTVLEKEVKEKNFLTIKDPLVANATIEIPSGPYMKLNPNNFSATTNEDPGGNFVSFPAKVWTAKQANYYPVVSFPVTVSNGGLTSPLTDEVYTIPAGSRIKITYSNTRRGRSTACEERSYKLLLNLTATREFSDFEDFFINDNVASLLNNGESCNGWPRGTCSFPDTTNSFNSTAYTTSNVNDVPPFVVNVGNSIIDAAETVNYWRFYKNTATGKQYLMATGTSACGSADNATSRVSLQIEVIRASSTCVFETIPTDASPDIWYENDLSFDIDSLGQHTGNVQNQVVNFQNAANVTPQDAIIDTGFYNCIAFGDGIESFKIRDSIVGKPMNFGNRVFTTSAQIYKRAHRFADLTYSGVFNDESNVNKLNEFNLGLANFKPLEDIYGPIQKLHARRTDILTFQEDKISYVLQGKDILTDAGGGGTLTSVPTVLGQQIARDEEFGISNNPESFAVYGNDKFFTDAKRGAVLQLKGGEVGPEVLAVISEVGMRGWFRDFFIDTIGNQKLGGYDPYMNEYVLASNGENIAGFTNCLPCGVTENVVVNPAAETIYCVNVTENVGNVAINYVIPNSYEDDIFSESGTGNEQLVTEQGIDIGTEGTTTGVGYTIKAIYNNVEHTTGLVYVSGTLTINKNSVEATQVTLIVTTNSLVSDTIQITTECPIQNILTIYNIALTSASDAGLSIHNQYSWTDNIFSSPLHSSLVTFASSTNNPIVSQYESVSGVIGTGVIPNQGALVNMISNKILSDNFNFNTSLNKFRYLRTNTLYPNDTSSINLLLGASDEATPIVTSGNKFSAEFAMPNNVGDILYMIWDYRQPTEIFLNQGVSAYDACCNGQPLGPTINCNTVQGGGYAYPDIRNVDLGTGTGTVELSYAALGEPDKFIVEFDGVEVINTGYRGNSSQQGDLNAALANLGQPAETIQGVGTGTASFTKSTATTTATVKVFAPISNSTWQYTLGCPGGVATPTPTPTVTPTPTPTVTPYVPTPTPTATPTPTPTVTPLANTLPFYPSNTGGGTNPSSGYSTASGACNGQVASNFQTAYFTQNVTSWQDVVNNNLIIYTTPTFNVPYNGFDTYFKTAYPPNTGQTFLLGGDPSGNYGQVSNLSTCSPPPTPTPNPSPVAWYLNGGEQNGFTNKSDSCNYNVASGAFMYLFYSPGGGSPVNIQSTADLDFAYSNNYAVIAYTDALQQNTFNGSDAGTGLPMYYGSALQTSGAPGLKFYIGANGIVNFIGSSYYETCLQEFTMTAYNYFWTTSSNACTNGSSSPTQTFYHTGNTSCLSLNDIVYVDTAKKQKLSDVAPISGGTGSGLYWYQPSPCGSGNGQSARININSTVNNLSNC